MISPSATSFVTSSTVPSTVSSTTSVTATGVSLGAGPEAAPDARGPHPRKRDRAGRARGRASELPADRTRRTADRTARPHRSRTGDDTAVDTADGSARPSAAAERRPRPTAQPWRWPQKQPWRQWISPPSASRSLYFVPNDSVPYLFFIRRLHPPISPFRDAAGVVATAASAPFLPRRERRRGRKPTVSPSPRVRSSEPNSREPKPVSPSQAGTSKG